MKRLPLLFLAMLFLFPLWAMAASGPLKILTVGERSLDGRAALMVMFSKPLDAKGNYEHFLTVTGPGKRITSGAWVVGDNPRQVLFPHVEPKTAYTVTIREGLSAQDGSLLTAPRSETITTRDMPPAYGFVGKGYVLPGHYGDGLPVMTVNVSELDVEFFRVRYDELPRFLRQYDYYGSGVSRSWRMDELAPFADSVYKQRYSTSSEKNRSLITHIPIGDIRELSVPGLYLAVINRPGEFNDFRAIHFTVGDIGLHARVYGSSGTLILANSLASGKPLPGLQVRLMNLEGKVIEAGVTSEEGMFLFKQPFDGNHVVTAFNEAQLSLLPLRSTALDLSEFPVRGEQSRLFNLFVHSPRDLYRPGETVPISILLRDRDGHSLSDMPLSARLLAPDGREIRKVTLTGNALGYFEETLQLPKDAKTGKWSLEVRADPAAKQADSLFRFQVEEFLPERMKLAFNSGEGILSPGRPWVVEIQGDYLYGAPAAGNRLTFAARVVRQDHPLPQLPEFFFGNNESEMVKRRWEPEEAKTDESGHYQFSDLPLDAPPDGPVEVRLTTSLFETGGRPVTRTARRALWPAEALVGVRPLFADEATANSEVAFEILRAQADGFLTKADNLAVTVIKEERDHFWTFSDEEGWQMQYSEASYPVLETELALKEGEKGKVTFPVTWGRYRLEVNDPDSGLTTRYSFQAGWDWEAPGQASARPDRVALSFDKPSYQNGDTARLTIKPPQAGEGILLVEGDHLLWHKRLSLPAEGITVEIPVKAEWQRHDLHVTLLSLRPGEAQGSRVPKRAVGLAHIKLEREARRVQPVIEVAPLSEPERPLPITVRLPELAGQQAMVTVAAVDMGILNITDFKTPDPFAFFFAKRGYLPTMYDFYGQVLEDAPGDKMRLRYGGDADPSAGGKRPDSKVKTVALFSGAVEVDPDGVAQVDLPLPDFNGALRVMVVAFSADRFGNAEKEITVRAPVVAEVAMPRFLSPGDESVLTLDLHNMSGQQKRLRLTLGAREPLVLSPVEQQLALADNERTTLRFPLRAEGAFGVGSIELTLVGDGVDIKRQWELGVRPPWPGVRRQQFQILQPGETLSLQGQEVADLSPKTVEYTLIASSTPPIDIRQAVKGLLEYPFGCLEQTSSRVWPNLYVDEATAKEIGVPPFTLEKRRQNVEDAFTRLAGMQKRDGGFGLWNANSPEEEWLSAYVTDLMLHAKRQGFQVPEEVLKRALDRLFQRLQQGGTVSEMEGDEGHEAFAARAYAAYVLAGEKRVPLSTLWYLFEKERKAAKAGLPLIHLGLALGMQGDQQRSLVALQEGLSKKRPEDGWRLHDYGSPVRDDALILSLLADHWEQAPAIQKISKEAEQLFLGLAESLRDKQWFSTQERFALFKLGSIFTQGDPWKARLVSPQGEELLESERRILKSFTLADLQGGLALTNQGQNPLYLQQVTSGYTVAPPAERNDPLKVRRAWWRMDGTRLEKGPLKVGEMFLAQLLVQGARDVRDGLLVDLLPAGLELENANISRGEGFPEIEIDGVSPVDAMESDAILHQGFLDDRYAAAIRIEEGQVHSLFYLVRVVSPGRFIVPPPFVESMYLPEDHGVGPVEGVLEVVE